MSRPAGLRDFRCERSNVTMDGAAIELLTATWTAGGKARRLTCRVLNMGEQWDFLEVAGHGLDNRGWLNMAMCAASVMDVDGSPVIGRISKQLIRDTLNKLGKDGLQAVSTALATIVTDPDQDEAAEAAERNAVGN